MMRIRWRRTGDGRAGPAVVSVGGAAILLLVIGPLGLGAQEGERIPTVPAGTPAVFFPVQAARPTAGGAWPGGARNEKEVLETLQAELDFAFGEEEDADSWALPHDVVGRLRRNPMIHVDPYRLAYHGLIREPKPEDQIYEPLHTQLRQVAALFNARIVVLPMLVWYEPEPQDPEAEAQETEDSEAEGSPDEREAGSDPEAGDAPVEADAAEVGEQEAEATAEPVQKGRAVVLTAVIDVRRSAVLWHGEIRGAVAEPGSSLLLTTLALAVADQLVPS